MTDLTTRFDRLLIARRVAAITLAVGATALFAFGMGSTVAEDSETVDADIASRIAERRLGEEQQILNRREWFFSTRRDGSGSTVDLWKKRLDAVEQTRAALSAQRARRGLGLEQQQNFWVPKGPSPSTFGGWSFGTISGRIMAIASDWNGTLYAGAAAGGVWKSTNDGLSWTSIFDTAGTLTVGAITVDPNDSDVLWVGTGDNVSSCESYFGIGLLRSADGGATWELRNGGAGGTLQDLSSFAAIIVDPRDSTHMVVGGRIRNCASGSSQPGGIYSSNDGGVSWTARLGNSEVYEVLQDKTVQDTFWASTSNGVYKSVDNAVSWVQQTASGLPNGGVGRTEIAIAPSDSNTVYALFASGPEFWRTTDGGASWTEMSNGSDACDGQCWYNMTIRVHNTNPDTVYRGTIRIFRSLNGGASWNALTNGWGGSQQVHQDTHQLLMDPNNSNSFYVSGDGGLWKSENGGSSFLNRNGNMNVTQFYAIDVDPNDTGRICGGAQDNSSLARDGNDVWALQIVTGDGFVCQIDPTNSNIHFVTSYPSGGYPSVYKSTNGLYGSFSKVTGSGRGIVNGDRINWVTPYTLDPNDPAVLYLGTHRVYKSSDHGESWALVSPDVTGNSSSLIALEVNRGHSQRVFSGSASGRVWTSEDFGVNWSDISSGLPGNSIKDVAGDPTNPDRAFAVVGGFNLAHVWEWTKTGGWVARDGGLPNVPHNTVVMLSATDIVVGNDVGAFRSQDGGQTFVPLMNGLPEGMVVTDIKFSEADNLLTAGTYSRGAWQLELTPAHPVLLVDSVLQPLVEVDGDGDATVEPGETWSASPVLRNAGGVEAVDARGRLATATPGVTLLGDAVGQYGTIAPGATATAGNSHEFMIDPDFACGSKIVFDVVELTSSNPPIGGFDDQMGVLDVTVVGGYGAPDVQSLLDESFDPAPAGWPHQVEPAGLPNCGALTEIDQWNLASKDAGHGTSFHCGAGPGSMYGRSVNAWLYPAGKDSDGGVGFTIPAEAIGATLVIEHWYDTVIGEDGATVLIDGSDDGDDVYSLLTPVGGYPGGNLSSGRCNVLEGNPAFQGASGGWVTSTFDLFAYRGQTVFPAFVFGSDRGVNNGEGWYVDEVRLEYQLQGVPECDVAGWPGSVTTANFDRLGLSTLR